jgi:putative ABC transport system permease protein
MHPKKRLLLSLAAAAILYDASAHCHVRTSPAARAQFLSEALVLSLIGGLIGVATGVGGSWAFEALGKMRTIVVPISILVAFLSAAVVGIFFGFYPANKACQLDPIEALRYE